MNKTNRDIIKSIKQFNAETLAEYKKLFEDFKKQNIIVFDRWDWNRPNVKDFRTFGNDAKMYIKSLSCNRVTRLDTYDICELIKDPANFNYVTADELKKFETVTYPKLYAEWCEELKKKKRAANGEDAAKIRAKIEKLQHQLEELENA